MKRLALSTAAAAIAMSLGAAQADTPKDGEGDTARTDIFEKIDQNGNNLVTREEFVDYATEERGLERVEAQALFNEIVTPDPVVTLVMFRDADKIKDWDEKDRNKGDQKTSQKNANAQWGAAEKMSNNVSMEERTDPPLLRQAMNDDAEDDGDQSEKSSSSDARNSRSDARNANFAAMDDNDDGYVTKDEFTSYISAPSNVSEKEARKLFDAAAGDDDRLTLAEFVQEGDRMDRVTENTIGKQNKNTKTADYDRKDKDKDWKSDKQADASGALSDSVKRHKEKMTQSETAFDEIDRNGNEQISRSEFLKYEQKQAREAFDEISGDDNTITRAELRSSDRMRKAELEE